MLREGRGGHATVWTGRGGEGVAGRWRGGKRKWGYNHSLLRLGNQENLPPGTNALPFSSINFTYLHFSHLYSVHCISNHFTRRLVDLLPEGIPSMSLLICFSCPINQCLATNRITFQCQSRTSLQDEVSFHKWHDFSEAQTMRATQCIERHLNGMWCQLQCFPPTSPIHLSPQRCAASSHRGRCGREEGRHSTAGRGESERPSMSERSLPQQCRHSGCRIARRPLAQASFRGSTVR